MNRRREGFTLVEVVVAMTVLAVLLSMMGGMTFSVARQSLANGTAAQRQAASLELVNRYTSLPVDSLQSRTDTVKLGGNTYVRSVVRSGASTDATVTFVIKTQPLLHKVPPVEVTVVRSGNAVKKNPLCHPSC